MLVRSTDRKRNTSLQAVGHRMKRKREVQDEGSDSTPLALLVAFLGGIGIVLNEESLLGDLQTTPDSRAAALANWQVHMGAVCMGMTAFVVIFFLLHLLERKSKMFAWRCTWPWLPLIGVTALAAMIHIPAYAVALLCVIGAAWAYHRTRLAKRTPIARNKVTSSSK
jgi:hypothetical protein